MGATITILGQNYILSTALHAALDVDDPLKCHLYKNDPYTPTLTNNSGDFTEADFSGYDSITLDRVNWNCATTVGSVANANYCKPLVWTSTDDTDPADVYGFYVTNSVGDVLWAESFGGKTTIQPLGNFTLTLGLALVGDWYYH